MSALAHVRTALGALAAVGRGIRWVALAAALSPLSAQEPERLSLGAIAESYSFDAGYGAARITQLTMPLGVRVPLGSRASLSGSTGYASVILEGGASAQAADQRLHGPLDTEVRLDLEALPDRLITFLAVSVPTGRQTVADEQLGVLVALANDAIGFSAPALGSGGSVGGGFSAAVPVGRFALGVAANAVYAFTYEPVLSERVSLRPGAEARLRLGLEGALAGRTYLRVAGSIAARQKDRLGGSSTHGLGHRAIGYVTLEQGVGSALVALYAFDVYRGAPQLESTVLGAAILPRGNLLAGGAVVTLPLGRSTTLAPAAEYRVSAAAESTTTSVLVRQASAVRVGAELRRRVGAQASVVLRGQGAFGDVRQGSAFHGFRGFRAGASLEMTP